MKSGLAFSQTPPFEIPVRFFLTAPWFLILAGALILWQGEQIFSSRWMPATLALTHLLVLGFMAQVMLGAVLQILPVVLGVAVPQQRILAALVHIFLNLGTLVLVGAFLSANPFGFQSAIFLLGIAFISILLAANIAVWQAPISAATAITLRCALFGLAVTVVLGLVLASNFAGYKMALALVSVTNVHVAWGLVGWTILLVAGVAYQVVPMFQITPPYPIWFSHIFAPAVLGLLGIGSLLAFSPWSMAMLITNSLVALASLIFALQTLGLLAQRKRKISDPTGIYWRISMFSLCASAVLWLLMHWLPDVAGRTQFELLLGILLIIGFASAVINGMLYKILPFLAWLHLQTQYFGKGKPPHIKRLLPEEPMRRQGWGLLVVLILLLAATIHPSFFAKPAGLALIILGWWLHSNLWGVWRMYRQAISAAP